MIEERLVGSEKVQWDTELGGAVVQDTEATSQVAEPKPIPPLVGFSTGEGYVIGPATAKSPAPADNPSRTVTPDAPTS